MTEQEDLQNLKNPEKVKSLDYLEKLSNGPISDEERSCTDILCFWLWVGGFILLLILSIISWATGHPDRLLIPYDSDGRACGI